MMMRTMKMVMMLLLLFLLLLQEDLVLCSNRRLQERVPEAGKMCFFSS